MPKIIYKVVNIRLFIYRGSPLGNHYFRAKPKRSVFENGKFSRYLFFDQKCSKKCNMLWRKSFENFLTLKCFFCQNTFLEKKIQKKFGKFFKDEKCFKIIFEFFFQKSVSWKNNFFECQKHFQNFFPLTFYNFLKLFGPKKSVR